MYIRTNIDKFLTYTGHDYTAEEVSALNAEQFDELPLSDQINIYRRFPDQYNRLTGRCIENTTPQTEDTQTEGEKFADEFESRWKAYMDAITAKKT